MKRVVAFDVGSHTIGIARSDVMQLFAHPLKTLRFQEKDWPLALEEMDALLSLHEIETYVIGLPLTLKNKESEATLRAKRFGTALEKHLTKHDIVPSTYEIVFFDERFSTHAAEQLLISADVKRKARKQVIDTVAAVIILDTYLARRK